MKPETVFAIASLLATVGIAVEGFVLRSVTSIEHRLTRLETLIGTPAAGIARLPAAPFKPSPNLTRT